MLIISMGWGEEDRHREGFAYFFFFLPAEMSEKLTFKV